MEVQHILKYPQYVKKSFEDRMEAMAIIRNRKTKVVFVIEKLKFIKVITVV